MFNFMKAVPVFAWPLVIAFFVSLPILALVGTPANSNAEYLLGLTSQSFWGLYFVGTLVSGVVIGFVFKEK